MKTTFLSLFAFACLCPTASASQPNFLVILCDDLGRGDLSCYGHPIIETPTLDRLAGDGIQFTDCYASSPVCSPSRAGLFTGRNPNRAGIYDWIAGGPVHLRRHEITIPSLLREAGYETMLSGKWHLNGRFNKPEEQPTPADHGFDYWFATHNNAAPNHRNPKNFVRNGEQVGPTEGYSSSVVVREALSWLDNREQKQKPFATFLTFHEPHAPIASPSDLVEKYEKQQTIPGQAEYWANVGQVDRAVSQMLSGLEERGLTEDTVVFFTSDNGPEAWMRYPGVWNAHGTPGKVDGVALRGMKLEVFEGGIRVPGILRWPAKVKRGQIIKAPISAVDLLPTLCELGGASIPADHHLDGTSFVPLLEGADELQRTTPLFWFYYNSRGYAHFALREGDYMFLASRTEQLFWPGTPYTPERFAAVGLTKVSKSELFNVREDPMEVLNIAKEDSDRHDAMRAKMENLLEEMQTNLPSWAEE